MKVLMLCMWCELLHLLTSYTDNEEDGSQKRPDGRHVRICINPATTVRNTEEESIHVIGKESTYKYEYLRILLVGKQ